MRITGCGGVGYRKEKVCMGDWREWLRVCGFGIDGGISRWADWTKKTERNELAEAV